MVTPVPRKEYSRYISKTSIHLLKMLWALHQPESAGNCGPWTESCGAKEPAFWCAGCCIIWWNYTYIGTESSVLCECWSCVFTLRCKANGRLRSLPFGALARGPGSVVFGFCGSGTATHAAPAVGLLHIKAALHMLLSLNVLHTNEIFRVRFSVSGNGKTICDY
ncbi:hypothetical protein WAI453_000674 [Rhynchosporium graminicola]